MSRLSAFMLILTGLVLVSAGAASAQTTAFTYQGRLTDNMESKTGTYDMQFALYDALTGGTQLATQTDAAVSVANGLFTVQLDFGAAAFPGAERYLEISVRRNSTESYQLLSPRQRITSTPYAIRALNGPGVASSLRTTSLILDGTVQTVLSRDITVPTAGFVLVIGTLEVAVTHTNGIASNADFGVSKTAGSFPANQDVDMTYPAALPSGTYFSPVTVQGLFQVSAGTHTFFLLGREASGSSFSVSDSQLSLLFVPTSYGTVTSTAP